MNWIFKNKFKNLKFIQKKMKLNEAKSLHYSNRK